MKRSRRRFLTVVAAGAAAAAIAPSSALAEAARRIKPSSKPGAKPAPKPAPTAPPAPGGPRASEVAKAKASVEQTVKTLREFPLANGAEPAFAFRALRRARGGR